MKSIVTESPETKTPTGPHLMRDKRNGQIILITDNGRQVALSYLPYPLSLTGDLFDECLEVDPADLEPFNGSVTLSNS